VIAVRLYPAIKRLFDLAFAGLLVVLVAPILLLAAIAIKLGSKGPVFFRQARAGKKGTIFDIYKFRSMRVETHAEDGREMADFERMTRVGKMVRDWSLDELPQLINIIKGEMSLIGPRPLLPEYLPHYSAEQMRRHEALPGVTGWAQINGRNAASWEAKFEYDVWYVENRSFRLDFKIFFLTMLKIFKREGVNQDKQNTMERFTGTKILSKSKIEQRYMR